MENDDTRKRILKAAVELLGENGYLGTTTRMIAEKAGVNEVTIFRKYGSKQEVFRSVLQDLQDRLGMAMKKSDLVKGEDFKSDLLNISLYLTEFLANMREAVLMILFEAKHEDFAADTAATMARFMWGYMADFLKTYSSGFDDKGALVPTTALAIMSFIFFRSVVREKVLLDAFPPSNRKEEMSNFIELLTGGIKIPESARENKGD